MLVHILSYRQHCIGCYQSLLAHDENLKMLFSVIKASSIPNHIGWRKIIHLGTTIDEP